MARSWFSSCTEIVQKIKGAEVLKEEEDEEVQPGQDHVFTFYESLTPEQKARLDEDYDDINVEEIEEAWNKALEINDMIRQGVTIRGASIMNWELKKPPQLRPGANLTKFADVSERKAALWRHLGYELYHKARVAVVVFSGGMDTRMGDNLPKGTLDIGLLSHKSIFQLYVERVRRLQHLVYRKYRRAAHIPVYIMCNKDNRYVIEDFFRENEFFGMREQDLMFFTQGYSPMCNINGKFLLAEKHRVAMYPNGNGGVFRALMEQGMISDMKSRGVTCLFMCSIDNLLAKVGDPTFLGYCESTKAEAGLKVVEKLHPDESFGVFCSKVTQKQFEDIDGDGILDAVVKIKAAVLEFFEIPEDLRRRRTQMTNGLPPLELGSGNLSQYFFRIEFIKRTHTLTTKRWHLIRKGMPYVDLKTGRKVMPAPKEKNAYRLELFVFDIFEWTKSVVGLEVEREEFAVVKNMYGNDSPQTALQAMGRLHQRWILAAGGEFEDTRQSTEREDSKCEVSPLVSFAGEDLEGQFPNRIALPFYLPSQQELLEFSAASSAQTRRPSTHYLDWYSELAQRELEVELQGTLGPIMEMIEDTSKQNYTGEVAEETEVLPPTPRMEDGPGKRKTVGGKGKGKGHSPRSGRLAGDDSPGSAGSSPRSARSKGQDGEHSPDKMKSLLNGAPDSSGLPKTTRIGKPRTDGGTDAAAAGGNLSVPRPEDKRREHFWAETK